MVKKMMLPLEYLENFHGPLEHVKTFSNPPPPLCGHTIILTHILEVEYQKKLPPPHEPSKFLRHPISSPKYFYYD